MLDLSNPNDHAALEWACTLHNEDPSRFAGLVSWHRAHVATNPGPRTVALLALSSPTESAALLTALLDGKCDADVRVGLDGKMLIVAYWGRGLMPAHEVTKAPALILAILRLAPGDRDGALAALRVAAR
jgi:hypothetical protein